MITMGSGLQGTLIGLRARIEGFSIVETGMVMSCYYGGFFLGSRLAPNVITSYSIHYTKLYERWSRDWLHAIPPR